MKWSSFIWFFLLVATVQTAQWLQINLQFINPKWKDNLFLVLLGIPFSVLWMKSTQFGVEAFDGKLWPQRFIAFSVGIVIYTMMTYFLMGEKLTAKSLVCLGLAFSIVTIQVVWK